jgi:hypothetical protein
LVSRLSVKLPVSSHSQLVYDPHLAPKFELWLEQRLAERRIRRRAKEASVIVPAQSAADDKRTDSASVGAQLHWGSKDAADDTDHDKDERTSVELERIVAKEVDAWRSQVDRSQQGTSELRQRSHVSVSSNTMDEV